MISLCYSIWADAINYERIKNGGEGHWKSFTFSYMSILLSLNIAAIFSAILFFTNYDLTWKLKEYLIHFSNESIRNILWAIIVLFSPSMLFNYFFIFYKNRYEYILANYEFKGGKFLLIYFLVSVIILFGFSLLNKFFVSFSELLSLLV